jgi:NADPH-dependent 2,4-dienoyl-CoA reductase/sulfur reductase-like enzyme
MEAARVSAMRGHEVILYEKGHKLGGLLPLASLVKGHEGEYLMEFVRYLQRQVTKMGIDIRTGKEFDLSLIEELKPDAVIVAMGGIPTVPEIPGINRRNVVSVPKLHRMLKFYLRFLSPELLGKLTKIWMPIGKNVVIIGGGLQGCELAEFLVKRGRKVTIVEAAEKLGEGVPERKQHPLFRWLQKKGVTMLAGVKYEEITENGLTIVTKEGERRTIEGDTIIPAVPLLTNTGLLETLKGKVAEVYIIGDCVEPKVIIDAIAAGYRAGNTL